jgi:hypothetical protein
MGVNKGEEMVAKIVNIKIHKCDIFVGRNRDISRFHWGNPFIIGKDGDRQEVVARFKMWFLGLAHQDIEPERRAWMVRNLFRLKGRTLGCFCKPLDCHGDILLKEANK